MFTRCIRRVKTLKKMLHGKEKIWFLLNVLAAERELTSDNEPVALHPLNDLNNHYSKMDFINLLNKLEKDNVARLLNSVPTDQTYGKYLVELLPSFDKYIKELEEDSEYLEWSGKKPKPENYFSPERRVDFSKTKEENKDKYISVGQIQELMEMPKDKRARIEKDSLTKDHLDDISNFQKNLMKTAKAMKPRIEEMISKIKLPDLSRLMQTDTTVTFVPPANYEAQTVGLLKQLVEKQKEEDVKSDNKTVLTITYTSSRQVMLNSVFQLAKPSLNGTNDLVFGHLYKNAGKSFSKRQLETAIGQKITKTLHKIVENLGFKGDLARAFFSVSKNDIVFRNPISREELNDMGLGKIKLI